MKTRVIQDEQKPTEAAPPAPEADQEAAAATAAGSRTAEESAKGAKP